jgi:hypothetical protein
MKITKKVKVEIEKEEIVDILCNKCGESLGGFCDYHGLVEVRVVGGFQGPVFEDCDEYTFSLCEKCLKGIFDECKIKPEFRNRLDYDLNDDIENNVELTPELADLAFNVSDQELEDVDPEILSAVFAVTKEEGEGY